MGLGFYFCLVQFFYFYYYYYFWSLQIKMKEKSASSLWFQGLCFSAEGAARLEVVGVGWGCTSGVGTVGKP